MPSERAKSYLCAEIASSLRPSMLLPSDETALSVASRQPTSWAFRDSFADGNGCGPSRGWCASGPRSPCRADRRSSEAARMSRCRRFSRAMATAICCRVSARTWASSGSLAPDRRSSAWLRQRRAVAWRRRRLPVPQPVLDFAPGNAVNPGPEPPAIPQGIEPAEHGQERLLEDVLRRIAVLRRPQDEGKQTFPDQHGQPAHPGLAARPGLGEKLNVSALIAHRNRPRPYKAASPTEVTGNCPSSSAISISGWHGQTRLTVLVRFILDRKKTRSIASAGSGPGRCA